ncbi:MAG: tyrosyl-tRNA synthetase [Parcubacteria group bacterium Gr01-1014_31]|nr:MAG: tyrosyl-tRNA synthetase [Parcubacteria group bacterium Gr01-1014_31]
MPKISTDPKLIAEVLERGVQNIYPSKEAFGQALASGRRLTIYNGIDPTGQLHLGHGVVLLKLRQLQQLGHRVIVLFGGFTAQIGDPTDKLATRQPLSAAQIKANAKNYKKLIGKILDPKATVWKDNATWWDKITAAKFLELASELSAARIWERDMFQERLKQGKEVHLHELLYPLLQGYDSVAMDVDAEVGGNDQTVNMLVGREMLKRRGKEKFVLTCKLLVDPTGKKMGKTEGNFVAMDDSPQQTYGKVMSWPDSVVPLAFELATVVPLPEVVQVRNDLAAGKNPKILKMLLSYKITELYHGTPAAISAEEHFKQVFERGEKPTDIPEVRTVERALLEVLVACKLAASRTDARRLIQQGGVKVNGVTVKDERFEVPDAAVIQKGKRFFVGIKRA